MRARSEARAAIEDLSDTSDRWTATAAARPNDTMKLNARHEACLSCREAACIMAPKPPGPDEARCAGRGRDVADVVTGMCRAAGSAASAGTNWTTVSVVRYVGHAVHVGFGDPCFRFCSVTSWNGAWNQRDASASRRKNAPAAPLSAMTSAVCHGSLKQAV